MNTDFKKSVSSLLLALTSFLALTISGISMVSAAPTVGTNVRVTTLSYNQNEPSVAVNTADNRKFVVGYNDFSTGSTWRLGWSWSDNSGSSWARGGMFTVSGYSYGANPIVAFDNTGVCYYAGMVYNPYTIPSGTWSRDGSIFLAKSIDGGHTFTVFQKTIATGSGINPSLDRPWMYINPVSNHIYLAWVKRVNAWATDGTQRMTIWFTRSTDGGATFSTPIQIGSDLDVSTYPCSHGPQIAVGPGSTVYVSWHTVESGTLGSPGWVPPRIWISQSTDDGATFSSSYLVAIKQNSYPAMFITMETHSPSGRIYIAYCERPTYPGDMDVYVATADSVAGPWTIRRINDDPIGNGAGQWYPALDVAPNGRVDVIWYDFRAGSSTRNVYYSTSRDQGNTWEVNTKVTDATSASSDYAGDYVGSVVSRNQDSMLVWGDGRHGSNINQEIYSAVLTMTGNDGLTFYDRSIESAWKASTPTIDGAIAAEEWDDATEIKPIWQNWVGCTRPWGVYARFKNDADYLYVLYEVDIVPYYSTAAWMTFDTNNDHAYTAGKEQDFAIVKLFGDPGTLTTIHQVSVDSSGTFATDCSPFDTTKPNHAGLAVGIAASSSARDSRVHPIIEWKIPLALLGVTPSQTMGFAMSGPNRDGIVYGEYMNTQWPEYRSISGPRPISDYGHLVLASPPSQPTLALEDVECWYWTSWTYISCVAREDVDGDGNVEIVTGGHYNDGTQYVAQLCVWNGATLALEDVTTWYWTSDTCIWSVAAGDVDGDGAAEIVTGGYYDDGTREVAQLCVWNGASLALENVKAWYWTSNTEIWSVALGDTDGDAAAEIVTGGNYYDGTRTQAQLCVWNGATLALEGVTTWYWTSDTNIRSVATGDVDGDASAEIVTGGYYFEGDYPVAQLCVWSGATLALENVKAWLWGTRTAIYLIAFNDVDADGLVEIITGGGYNDGTPRVVAQLCVWSGASLALENVQVWYWIGNTQIWSVAAGDVDGDGSAEIVTGGYYNDGTRSVGQLCVWSGASLALENVQGWYWTDNTCIYSVATGDIDADGFVEIVTGGNYYDGTRDVAQLCVWA